MPAAKDVISATQENSKVVFDSFKQHCHGTRTDTKTEVLTLLRNSYQDYHVTQAEQHRVSLFEFAGAGKAQLNFDNEDEGFNATRRWKSVGEGIEKKMHPGALEDDFQFVRFQYIWEGNEYLVYYITWKDMLESAQRNFYILHPRSSTNVVSGHCVESDALVLAAGKWTSQLHEEIFVFDDGRWEKSKELWKAVNGSSWDDVILGPEMKRSIIEDVQGFFDNQKLYAQYAVPWKRGIILHGVPGNGKTCAIRALMSSLYQRADNIPSLYVKAFENKCNTEQYAIRQIFLQARAAAPCLLIFEDLDSLVNDDIRSYFLNEVDGLESNDGIMMIGSTNHLDKLDPAIAKRPSRFDRKYHFKLPNEEERSLYAEYWRKKLLKNQTVEFPEELCPLIAKLTEGFSFAYLKELFVMALLSLVRGFKGDDFEIVDAEEAASAKGEDEDSDKAANASATTSDDKKEPETCQCKKTCSNCNKPFPAEKKKADEKEEKKEEMKKNKMAMPTIEIPDHLQDNALLRVIKHQIRILHNEMDNTEEKNWASGKKGMGGDGKMTRAAMMRAIRMAR